MAVFSSGFDKSFGVACVAPLWSPLVVGAAAVPSVFIAASDGGSAAGGAATDPLPAAGADVVPESDVTGFGGSPDFWQAASNSENMEQTAKAAMFGFMDSSYG
jgi:hypothetical protein